MNERIREIGEDDEKALSMGLGQCSENYLHCIFLALSMQTWLNP